MEKKVAAFEARRQFGKILQDVLVKGDAFVVERHGEPVAAIVPVQVYRFWQEERDALFESMRVASETANMSEEDAMALANEVIQEVRAEKARKKHALEGK
ncbi:MAG: type II toxin-antitoxin system Phd/YefM family antitoxin [Chloroflexi bacterium]|nr:type II toxin-antitoxin system Phd/YefM family antitoxin [Chloroflexota bacterium]